MSAVPVLLFKGCSGVGLSGFCSESPPAATCPLRDKGGSAGAGLAAAHGQLRGCPLSGSVHPPPFVPLSRFAAGEYLDAAFLTKLMCCGRELHDFLTLPAQVRGELVGQCCADWAVLTGLCCWRGCARRRHNLQRPTSSPCSALLHPLPLLYLFLPRFRPQDIIIAMGK